MLIDGIMLTPEKAAIIGEIAVISDLHLGIENYLQKKGFALPRVQIKDIARDVKRIIKKYGVKKLVIAGDFKHEFGKMPYDDIEDLLSSLSEIDVIVVKGNHDASLSSLSKRIKLVDSFEIDGCLVLHGHRKVELKGKAIIGHEHPVVRIRYRGAIYTFPCYLRYKSNADIIVLPAFSPLVSGSDVLSLDSFLSPMLPSVDDVEVYAIEDDVFYLGKVRDLKNILANRSFSLE